MIDTSLLPSDVSSHIRKFREFLNISWPYLDNLMEFHDWDNDAYFICQWMQSCWTFLVQRELLGIGNKTLTPFRPTSKFFEGDLPTHMIQVIPKISNRLLDPIKNKEISNFGDLRLLFFLAKLDIGSGIYPPFDVVYLYDKKNNLEIKANFEDVSFVLCEYKS